MEAAQFFRTRVLLRLARTAGQPDEQIGAQVFVPRLTPNGHADRVKPADCSTVASLQGCSVRASVRRSPVPHTMHGLENNQLVTVPWLPYKVAR